MSGMSDALVEHIPQLRAFARSLCRNPTLSDDLVQDTLLRAWANRDRFIEGSNLRAWLFTILRNCFYSHMRGFRRQAADPEEAIDRFAYSPHNQEQRIMLADFRRAFMCLSVQQREVLALVCGSGCSHEETAEICGCAVGTIKSRVARARAQLIKLMDGAMPPGKRPEVDTDDIRSLFNITQPTSSTVAVP